MGCDIHGWVEYRYPTGNLWHGVICLDGLLDRWYYGFATLFDVRNGFEVEALYGRRGLPPDTYPHYLSQTAREAWEAGDADYHSPSWMTYDEFCAAHLNWTERTGWQELRDMCDILAKSFGPDNVRIVVWFDN